MGYKIAQVHNYYRNRGGEESVLDSERDLLEKNGNEVVRFTRDSNSINDTTTKIKTLLNLSYSEKIRSSFYQFCREEKPDIVHVHNTYPLITPSIFDVTQSLEIPSVYTLHNYRLIYPNGLMLNNNVIDTRTITGSAYSTVKDKVFNNSYLYTFALARLIEYHRKKNTWNEKVDAFICLTDFAKSIFVRSGIQESKVFVKPNFMSYDLNGNTKKPENRDFFLFVGRISNEKGIDILIEAANILKDIPIKIAGSGDELERLKDRTGKNVEWLGHISREEVIDLMSSAVALVFPSRWYEGFPMTIVESMYLGLPVISSNIGNQSKIVEHNITGLHFQNENTEDLADSMNTLIDNTELWETLSDNSIAKYQNNYSKESNYETLMTVYQSILEKKRGFKN